MTAEPSTNDPAVSKPEGEEESTAHFDPVIKLTDQVETKTHEEDEDALLKMRSKLFRFEASTSEWKERGTGDVRILQHKETKKCRLVMRREKTHKVCANHLITTDMRLQPNIGSDRSWVWKVAADISDGEPVAETLAIRFANSDNAGLFKTAFENAQEINASLAGKKVDAAADADDDNDDDDEESKGEKASKVADAKETSDGTEANASKLVDAPAKKDD